MFRFSFSFMFRFGSAIHSCTDPGSGSRLGFCSGSGLDEWIMFRIIINFVSPGCCLHRESAREDEYYSYQSQGGVLFPC